MVKSKSLVVLATMLMANCVATKTQEQSMNENGALAFEAFKKLSGTYLEVEGDGKPARIEYSLIARGAALKERWIMPPGDYGPEGKEELTVFHMDNGELVATHYCAVGIHPTMVLDPESPSGTYNFIPRTVSNLASLDQSHNSAFGYTFEDSRTVLRSEQWTISGETSVSYLRMMRSPD